MQEHSCVEKTHIIVGGAFVDQHYICATYLR
jgi:hypothetical protein